MTDLSLTKEQIDLLRNLNALRQEVALNYIAGGYENGAKAYLDACKKLNRNPSKNPATSASEILNYPNVIEFIDSVKQVAAKSVNIDAQWVLTQAVKVHERCMQSAPVLDRGGNQVFIDDPSGSGEVVPAYTFEYSGANKALEIIGKHIDVQAFNEKSSSEVTHKVSKTLAERLLGGSKR